MQFQILTWARPGEVRGAMQSEFDLKKAVWHVPAERMKMRRPHDVPLSRQALHALEEIASPAYWYQTLPGAPLPALRDRVSLEII